MTIAILKHSTENLGDDIQRVALERLLPKVDIYVDRDDVAGINALDSEVKLILYGWFSRRRHTYRTSAQCLYTGYHIDAIANIPSFVGCRDLHTLKICRKQGIPAWMSWCTTLAFEPSSAPRNGVILVDVANSDMLQIPEELANNATIQTHQIDHHMSFDARTELANAYLEAYRRAELVITSRLHVALPCIAFGTPVVFTQAHFDSRRWHGYHGLVWRLHDCPWAHAAPDSENPWIQIPAKVSPEYALGMSSGLRESIAHFIAE